jgi:hypothetical protein
MSELIIEQDAGDTGPIPSITLKNMDTGESVPIPIKIKTKFRLICASKCKKFALEVARAQLGQTRSKMFTRVSEDFLIACEANLKTFIHSRVRSHPSRGKTLT